MTLVLRVLTGRLAGSEAPIVPGQPLSIGHGFDNAVVLRDAAAAPLSLTITADDARGWVELAEGAVELLGQPLAAPARALLPPFIPVSAGGFALAWGDASSPRWAEAEALARPAPPPALVQVAPAEAAPAPRPLAAPIGWLRARLADHSLYVTSGAVLTMLLVAPAFTAALDSRAPPVDAVRLALAADYPALTAQPSATGDVVVTGTVATDADRARVEALLARAGLDATVGVDSGTALAEATARVFRDHGVPARATWAAPGVVRVEAGAMAAETRARLVNLALGDVPGVAQVDVVGPAAAGVAAGYAVDAAAKRVASIVDGDPGYLITADGARYFTGALMPTGQRLVAISGRTITLEQGGVARRLTF